MKVSTVKLYMGYKVVPGVFDKDDYLKNDLQEVLKCVCLDQKKIKRKAEKNVFIGYKIVFHE